ncbi:MAG: hypothetical protein ABSG94_11570 [Brevinematales bacterium]
MTPLQATLSECDITRQQFSNVMGFDPVVTGGLDTGSQTAYSTGIMDPVMYANWYQAIVFCNDLSIMEGLTPVYSLNGSIYPSTWGTIPASQNLTWDTATANWSANGYRLPTEMEYMWAAMGAASDTRIGYIAGGVNTGGYTKG